MSDDSARASIRAALAGKAIPPQFVPEIADIAVHAADQAIETLMRISFSHPNGAVGTTAMGVALGVLRSRIELATEALLDVGAKCGATIDQMTVQL